RCIRHLEVVHINIAVVNCDQRVGSGSADKLSLLTFLGQLKRDQSSRRAGFGLGFTSIAGLSHRDIADLAALVRRLESDWELFGLVWRQVANLEGQLTLPTLVSQSFRDHVRDNNIPGDR